MPPIFTYEGREFRSEDELKSRLAELDERRPGRDSHVSGESSTPATVAIAEVRRPERERQADRCGQARDPESALRDRQDHGGLFGEGQEGPRHLAEAAAGDAATGRREGESEGQQGPAALVQDRALGQTSDALAVEAESAGEVVGGPGNDRIRSTALDHSICSPASQAH
jgi:hypothetical protein